MPFDPFEQGPYQNQRFYEAICGEDCYAQRMVELGIRSPLRAYHYLRSPSERRNLRKKLAGEQKPLADIRAERQRRIEEVKRRFTAGEAPMEIARAMGHRGVAIYADLRAAGLDPKQSRQAQAESAGKEALLERIGQLLAEEKQLQEIAPIVGLSLRQLGYITHKHFQLDGRKRQAARRKPAASKD